MAGGGVMARTPMRMRCITLDRATEERIEKLVPDIYPSLSELIRALIRKEVEGK
jgi:Arc/MetJ-type ribon-helix-helix transcriptional regulator